MLESFDAGAKPKIIREVKAMVPNLTLIDVSYFLSKLQRYGAIFMICVQAKRFVESLPKALKENQPKEDAEKLKATFEALGAVVKLE
jgi:large subunit ribosomal protein L7/L12